MSKNCQQCLQPLQIQQHFPQKALQDSYQQLNTLHEEELGTGNDENNILEHDAIFFGQADEAAANYSGPNIKGLRIKDFAEQKNIQLKHPVCFGCFEEILKQMEDQIKSQEQERDMYKSELNLLEEEVSASGGKQDADLINELEMLEREERELDKKLEDVGKREVMQQQMLNNLQKSKGEIEAKEENIWKKVNDYERELSSQLESNKQVDGQIKNLTALYKRLRQTNFINEVFHISTQDQFGTISGFRLGRISQLVEVEWDEINSAIGQSAYLMAVIAHRFGYKFDKYKINLCGAMSTIQLKYPQAAGANLKPKYELYCGGGAGEERFNTALEYLLNCLVELLTDVKYKMNNHQIPQDRSSQPYEIAGNEIGGQSIRYKQNESQIWTRAMKYFLTNLQWLVYMTQLRDVADQQDNTDMDKNSCNFNISGL